MTMFFGWIILAIIPAMIASSKGRSFFLWFLYGLFLWPIALVHILLVKSPENVATQQAILDIAANLKVQSPTANSPVSASSSPAYVTAGRKTSTPMPKISAPDGSEWRDINADTFDVRAVTKDNPDGVPRQEIIAALKIGTPVLLNQQADQQAVFDVIVALDGSDQTIGTVSGPLFAALTELTGDQTYTVHIGEISRVEGASVFLQPRIVVTTWQLGEKEGIEVGGSITYRGQTIYRKYTSRYILMQSGAEATTLHEAKKLVDQKNNIG